MASARRPRLPDYCHFIHCNQMAEWPGGPPAISFAARQEARALSAARAAEYAAVLVMRFIIIVSLSYKKPPNSFSVRRFWNRICFLSVHQNFELIHDRFKDPPSPANTASRITRAPSAARAANAASALFMRFIIIDPSFQVILLAIYFKKPAKSRGKQEIVQRCHPQATYQINFSIDYVPRQLPPPHLSFTSFPCSTYLAFSNR